MDPLDALPNPFQDQRQKTEACIRAAIYLRSERLHTRAKKIARFDPGIGYSDFEKRIELEAAKTPRKLQDADSYQASRPITPQ